MYENTRKWWARYLYDLFPIQRRITKRKKKAQHNNHPTITTTTTNLACLQMAHHMHGKTRKCGKLMLYFSHPPEDKQKKNYNNPTTTTNLACLLDVCGELEQGFRVGQDSPSLVTHEADVPDTKDTHEYWHVLLEGGVLKVVVHGTCPWKKKDRQTEKKKTKTRREREERDKKKARETKL